MLSLPKDLAAINVFSCYIFRNIIGQWKEAVSVQSAEESEAYMKVKSLRKGWIDRIFARRRIRHKKQLEMRV